jgi:SAM-dependent methyltransferase
MGRVLPLVSGAEQVLACNICGGVEHAAVARKCAHDLVRCVACGLVFVASRALADVGNSNLSVEASPRGEPLAPPVPAKATARRTARQQLRMLRRAVGRQGGLRLLDIGSSSGPFVEDARQVGFDALAVDWRQAGLADGRYDVVTLFDVVQLWSDPLGELAAMRRLLRPGGVLLQSTPNLDGLGVRLCFRLDCRDDSPSRTEPPRQLHWFSERTLAELTERAGYEVIRICQARVPIGCYFGVPGSGTSSPWQLACAGLFAPLALVGPWLGRGDLLYLAAHRTD